MPTRFFPLAPGTAPAGDWYDGRVPSNIEVGADSVFDSTFSFKHYFARGPIGLRVGSRVTFWRTSLAVEEDGRLDIGDDCYIADCNLVVHAWVGIGSRCFIAGGVTIADSDFHPLDPAQRLADSLAVSPLGNRARRPEAGHAPVRIDDDVWIGWHAVVLKGVHVGAGATIEPGALVLSDVPPGSRVAGNPARLIEGSP